MADTLLRSILSKMTENELKDVSRNADIQKFATQSVEYDGNGQQTN